MKNNGGFIKKQAGLSAPALEKNLITAAANANYNKAAKTVTVTVKKANQAITGPAASYSKTFGNKAFSLGAKAQTSLSYASSNTKAATVSSKGEVTIKGAGTAKITITAAANANYNKATKTVTVNVAKAAPTISVKTTSRTYTVSALKKVAQTFSLGANVNSKGKLSYKKASGRSAITVGSNGNITVKKRTKKGTYTAVINVTAAANGNYKQGTKKVTVKIIVK